MEKADIGLIGLAVMGRNLALNLHDHGFKVAIYNRTYDKTEELQKEGSFLGAGDLGSFFALMKEPRIVLLMVKAGKPVDEMIGLCLPFLKKGDILIDGGNSYYRDTLDRQERLKEIGIYFGGMGVSGGEEGARRGPAIMFGGDKEIWKRVGPIFSLVAAKAPDGRSCSGFVGKAAAGHYVKMVHNGIEYADMELIAESYDFMRKALNLKNEEMARIFEEWNGGELKSYLIEITARILKKKEGGEALLDKIADRASQKGTGKCMVADALERAIPLNIIAEAVMQRGLSSDGLRRRISKAFKEDKRERQDEKLIDCLEGALLLCKILAYAQGLYLLKRVSEEEKWDVSLKEVALLWRGGCIIRSSLLEEIAKMNGDMLEGFKGIFKEREGDLREIVARFALMGIPAPGFMAALCFWDSLKAEKLPANLIQAQRDLFGAHTYERVDKKEGEIFHTEW